MVQKLTRSNLFRLYYIEKDNWGRGLIVPHPIPEFLLCNIYTFFMKPIFSIFLQAIKFDCLLLAILKVFTDL